MNRRAHWLLAVAAASFAAAPAGAQALDRRVSSAPDGTLQFHFPARDGVCGNGRGMLRSDDGSYNIMGGTGGACAVGPVRVVVVRSGREILRVDTYAGTLVQDPEGGSDLGAVPAREASSWLLAQASTLEGRPARDVIFPATLADSSAVTPVLLTLVQDATRSRDVRRSAISTLARRRNEAGGIGADAVTRALDALAHNQQESESLRQSALSAISSFDRSEGIPSLLRFADETESWLSHQAFATLARSGDPRARRYIRDAIHRSTLTEDDRVAAIQSLGGDYSTAGDLKLLRDLYPSLNTDRQRDALISALGNAGGRENIDWLLALAKAPTESVQRRKRVLTILGRFDDPRVQAELKAMVEKM